MANIQITLLLPEEFLAEIDTYVKEQNLKRAPYIKELLFSAWQNRDVLAMSSGNNFTMSKDVENQEPNRDVLSAIFDWLKNNGTRCEEVLSQINANLGKLSSSLSNNKPIPTPQIKNNEDIILSTKTQEPTKKNDKTDLQKKTEQALEKYCRLPNYASFSHTISDPTDEEFQAFLENYSYDYEEDRTTIIATAAEKLNSTKRISQFLKMLYDKSCDDTWKNIYIELRKKNEFYLKDILYWTENRRLYIEEHPEHAGYIS